MWFAILFVISLGVYDGHTGKVTEAVDNAEVYVGNALLGQSEED